jgi:hypothetical protein
LACAAAGAASFFAGVGTAGLGGAILSVVSDLGTAVVVFAAAGGYGSLVVRRLRTPAPRALLAVSSVVVGLYALSTALLLAGTFLPGSLTPEVWWPVVGVGVALAAPSAVRAARRLQRRSSRSKRLGLTLAALVAVAAAAGLALAGATLPPTLVGRAGGDFYDVVSYHLQLPREFIDQGRISFLPHNTYGNYPLGCEMLFLLGMCLRGGAYQGMYAASMTHLLWGALAVVALATIAPRPLRRWSAALVATAPLVVYLSWLAFVELAQLACLVAALAWAARWARRHEARPAAMAGAMLGVACATKYLAVGLVAGPVLAAMAMFVLGGRGRRAAAAMHVALAAGVCIALMSPWLIRNYAHTSNPVFPLATGVFGAGHWESAVVARWNVAHASPPLAEKLPHLTDAFWGPASLGALPAALAAAAIAVVAMRRRMSRWAALCAVVLAAQVVAWATFTHMAARFLVPAIVPMALLAAWLVSARSLGRWFGRAAGALLVAALAVGVFDAWRLYGRELGAYWSAQGHSGQGPLQWRAGVNGLLLPELPEWRFVQELVGSEARVLLVCDPRAYGFGAEVRYTSIWEPGPLVELARQGVGAQEMIRQLRLGGITHIWINWSEIVRVRRTYGWFDEVTGELFDALRAAGASDVPVARGLPTVQGRPAVELLRL